MRAQVERKMNVRVVCMHAYDCDSKYSSIHVHTIICTHISLNRLYKALDISSFNKIINHCLTIRFKTAKRTSC